jgi:hypothetical protein
MKLKPTKGSRSCPLCGSKSWSWRKEDDEVFRADEAAVLRGVDQIVPIVCDNCGHVVPICLLPNDKLVDFPPKG